MSPPAVRRIESTANPAIKRWRSLHKRRQRDRLGLCIVEGAREVSRAREAGIEFEAVLISAAIAAAGRRLATEIGRGGAPIYELGEAALGKVSVRGHPADVIGIAHSPGFELAALPGDPDPLLLIADAIEKPGNLGAMLRSADGAGVDAVIASDPATDLVNPNVIRASQGAVFTMPAAAATGAAVGAWLSANQIRVLAASAAATTPLWDADLTGPLAVVIGSEHAGLSPAWRDSPGVSIPMRGSSDSLNASVAAALLLYESRRQRG